jgi:hypothetical protein
VTAPALRQLPGTTLNGSLAFGKPQCHHCLGMARKRRAVLWKHPNRRHALPVGVVISLWTWGRRSLMRYALGVLIALSAALCASCSRKAEKPKPAIAEPPRTASIRQRLLKPVNFRVKHARLADALEVLAKEVKIKVVLDPAVGAKADIPISLELRGVAAKHVLKWVLRPAQLVYDLREGAIFVTTLQNIRRGYVTVLHDVNDVTSTALDRRAPHIDLAGRRPWSSEKPLASVTYNLLAFNPASLMYRITHTIAPSSWGHYRGRIGWYGNTLTVFNTPEVQRRIAAMLDHLRASELIDVETQVQFYAAKSAASNSVPKGSRLLAEVRTRGRNEQLVHGLRGKSWPPNDDEIGRFTGALLEVRPLLSPGYDRVTLHARLGLWLPAGKGTEPVSKVRTYWSDLSAALRPGKPIILRMGVLPRAKGDSEIVLARLSVRPLFRNGKPPVSGPTEPEWRARLRQSLQRRVNLDFRKRPLRDCLMDLCRMSGKQVVLDPKIHDPHSGGADPLSPMTIRLHGVTLQEAWQVLLKRTGLKSDLTDGVLSVGPSSRSHENIVGHIYNIKDMQYAPVHRQPPKLNGVSPFKLDLGIPSGVIYVPTVAEHVKRHVRPSSWGAGNAAITSDNGRLRVYHLPEVQGTVRSLVLNLHKQFRREVQTEIALYSLPAKKNYRRAKAPGRGWKLLETLTTIAYPGQRTWSASGLAAASDPDREIRLEGAVADLWSSVGTDGRIVHEARILLLDENGPRARFSGSFTQRTGQSQVLNMGVVDSRRVVAVVRSTVRGGLQAQALPVESDKTRPALPASKRPGTK